MVKRGLTLLKSFYWGGRIK